MELRTTREMRRSAQLDKAMAKKADAPDTSSGGLIQSAQKQAEDRCTLSKQALAYLEQQNRLQQELDERRAKMEQRLSEQQNKSSELDMLSKTMDVMNKCLKIAASIMKGNRVPPEDMQYLMKNDPEGYRMALALRRENPDPKEEKSVLTDEDKNGGSTEGSGDGGEAPGVAAAGASGRGGEASGPAE